MMNGNENGIEYGTFKRGDIEHAKRLCDAGYRTFVVRSGKATTLGTVRPRGGGYDITHVHGYQVDDGTRTSVGTHVYGCDARRLYDVVAGNDDDTTYSQLACDGTSYLDMSLVQGDTPDGRYYC